MSEEIKATTETPAESMADYERELDASFQTINEGDIITGTVIGVSEEEIVLDLRYYTEGVIRVEDASDDPAFSMKDIEVGQSLSATVIRRDDGNGRLLLSLKEAVSVLAWDKLKALYESQENIHVKVSGVVNAGVVTYVEGIRGFIPASKLSLNYVEDLNEYLGKELDVRVITVDEEAKKLVLSAKEILREKAAEEYKQKVSNVEIGLVTEGTVETLQPYGAFVNLGNGMSGLVHISQISTKRIKHPSAVLKEGQTVKVKIIGVKDGKISLSMKALEDVAAEEITEEAIEIPETESLTTSLGSLFKNIKLN